MKEMNEVVKEVVKFENEVQKEKKMKEKLEITKKITNSEDFSNITNLENISNITNSGSESNIINVGYKSQIVNSGDMSNITNSGDISNITNSGSESHIVNSGSGSSIINSGGFSKITNSSQRSNIISSGHNSSIADSGFFSKITSSGSESRIANSGFNTCNDIKGENSVCFDCGIGGIIKGIKGTHIALCEWYCDEKINKWKIRAIKNTIIDGKKLKENTYYGLYNKKIKEIIVIDDMKFVVIKQKGEVKKVKLIDFRNNIITNNIRYIISDNDGNSAIGITIKEAKQNLIDKISDKHK